ncbi:hypothetical protein Ga0100231_023850 [Opitutaceae bacterium TAV4]|nr:hypothetical protein Ga0100231_023850 [Opitutaceae bacterium TAV4]RRK00746.1 hypothetical protein Ga0100230_023425 [Opitutaceae bacterium TAV3]
MTPEAQREAIAEACGFVAQYVLLKGGYYYRPGAHGYTSKIEEAGRFSKEYAESDVRATNGEVTMRPEPLPDYLNDLNAMHAAEETLSDARAQIYIEQLADVTKAKFDTFNGPPNVIHWCLYHATAGQRAEAFLRTVGRWEEGK